MVQTFSTVALSLKVLLKAKPTFCLNILNWLYRFGLFQLNVGGTNGMWASQAWFLNSSMCTAMSEQHRGNVRYTLSFCWVYIVYIEYSWTWLHALDILQCWLHTKFYVKFTSIVALDKVEPVMKYLWPASIELFRTIWFQPLKFRISVSLSTAHHSSYVLAPGHDYMAFGYGGSHLASLGSHLAKCSSLQTTKTST